MCLIYGECLEISFIISYFEPGGGISPKRTVLHSFVLFTVYVLYSFVLFTVYVLYSFVLFTVYILYSFVLFTVYVDTTKADELYKKVKILCFVITTVSKLDKTIPVVNATWGRRCNKVLFVLCPSNKKEPQFLSTCHIGEGSQHLTGKVRHAFQVSYDQYLNDFDWFLKADDDTYLVMENLRFVLSHHNPDEPGYLGYHFQKFMHQGYSSGGAGYVVSRRGVKELIEKGFKMDRCKKDGEIEDKYTGQCLEVSLVCGLIMKLAS